MPHNQLSAFHVLTVDDEKSIQRLVRNVLVSIGFEDITSASSGRQAIDLISSQKFDFIITDWRMDDLDGADLVRFVRSSPDPALFATPIIMLTGNTEAHYVKTALGLGLNGYLIKPFSAEQLVKRIRTVIEHPPPFVVSPDYRGPNRRHFDKGPPGGIERRKSPKK